MHGILNALADVLDGVLHIYFYVVLIAVLLSIAHADPHNPVTRLVRQLTEPVFGRIRKAMPFLVTESIDFTPAAVIVGILVLKRVLVDTLRHLA